MGVMATWVINLYCFCPECKNYVDLLDYDDFWFGRKLDIAENGTERSKNVAVTCPECDHDFVVFCVY